MSLGDLSGEALAAIQGAVGASNALLYRYDENGVVHGIAGSLSVAIPTYARELFVEDPVQHHLMRVDPEEHSIITLREMDPDAYERSAAYNDFYRPHDVHHLMGLWMTSLPYGAPGMTGILFTRSSGESDFTEIDAKVLARALPSFRAAARRFDRAERAERERRALQGVVSAIAPGPRLALDHRGALLWISPEAEAMLAPAIGRGGSIPDELRDAAARIAGLVPHDLAGVPPPFQVDLTVASRPITADLRLGREASGEPVVAVTLSAPKVSTVDALAERHGLTRAERAVLACLGEGLSNRAIGEKLFVSIETVKTHVQRVLGKLEVTSRTQAAVKVAGTDRGGSTRR